MFQVNCLDSIAIQLKMREIEADSSVDSIVYSASEKKIIDI